MQRPPLRGVFLKDNKGWQREASAPWGDDWVARSDFSTLADAEKIKGDPKRLKAAQAHAAAQKAAIAQVGKMKPAKAVQRRKGK